MATEKLPELPPDSAVGFDRQHLGDVYARALLGSLAQSPQAETVLRQFGDFVREILVKVPQFHSVMASPRISSEEKLRIFDTAMKGKVADELLQFIHVVGRKGRLDCLKEIYAAARRQWNTSRGIVEVHVTTATPLDAPLQQRIESALSQKLGSAVEIVSRVEPNVLGGLRVRVGDQVFDGTLSNRLATMGREAVERAVHSIRRQTSAYITEN